MGIESVYDQSIKTFKTGHYLGMTLDDAREEGGSVFRKFKKVDKNNNEKISFEEIIEQRDLKSKRRRNCGLILMGMGAYDCVANLLAKSKPTGNKYVALFDTVLTAGLGMYLVHKANKIDDETHRMSVKYYERYVNNENENAENKNIESVA